MHSNTPQVPSIDFSGKDDLLKVCILLTHKLSTQFMTFNFLLQYVPGVPDSNFAAVFYGAHLLKMNKI